MFNLRIHLVVLIFIEQKTATYSACNYEDKDRAAAMGVVNFSVSIIVQNRPKSFKREALT